MRTRRTRTTIEPPHKDGNGPGWQIRYWDHTVGIWACLGDPHPTREAAEEALQAEMS